MNYYFSDCDTAALAKEYGTPLYVMSEDIIIERLNEIKYSFSEKYKDVQAYYASKAFLTKEMARIIKREGLGLDVVSGGELYTARSVDFPMEKIMFHGNNKTHEEIEMALEFGIGRFVCDNFYEIQLINQIAGRTGVKADILLRVTPGVDSHTHKYITTGLNENKFGINEQDLPLTLKTVKSSSNIKLIGIHFHIGSQITDLTSFENEYQ